MRCLTLLAVSSLLAGFIACSDDDGSDVLPNIPPGAGGNGGANASDAGPAGAGGSGGSGGSGAGTAGTGGGGAGSGGSGGSAGCTPISLPDAGLDAGATDAGLLDAGDLDASAVSPNGIVSFEANIQPIFAASCGPCHVADGSAGHNVGGELPGAYDDAVRISPRLVERINGGGMPPSYADPPNDCGGEGRGDQPGDPGCLTVEQVSLVQTWIEQCYPR